MDKIFNIYVSELHVNPPANNETLKKIEEHFKVTFPNEYVEFMLTTNGAEGDIGDNSYLVIWSAEELIELNKAYEVNEFAPGLILFGSNGGVDAYAFDARKEKLPIIQVPFIGMSLNEVNVYGETFIEFLDYLYTS